MSESYQLVTHKGINLKPQIRKHFIISVGFGVFFYINKYVYLNWTAKISGNVLFLIDTDDTD